MSYKMDQVVNLPDFLMPESTVPQLVKYCKKFLENSSIFRTDEYTILSEQKPMVGVNHYKHSGEPHRGTAKVHAGTVKSKSKSLSGATFILQKSWQNFAKI